MCDVSVFQLRTAMVKGDTGTLALDVKATVDKGVSTSSSTTIQWYFTKDILSLSTSFMIFFFFLSLTDQGTLPEERLLPH